MITKREHFFSVLEGSRPEKMPFVPDITDWYIGRRTPEGQPRKYWSGAFISDSEPIHKMGGSIPEPYWDFTLFDFYKHFGWGFHAHVYNWYEFKYDRGVVKTETTAGREKTVTIKTPRGEVVHKELMASDGTWCPKEHFVKNRQDLEIIRDAVNATYYEISYDRIKADIDAIGDQGQVDIVIPRSPFGKLVHEYMGYENAAYALCDMPEVIEDFLELQRQKDIELIEMACRSPARLVIISDHADENLISPRLYREYCVPYYREVNKMLHDAGKFVSTHLDGNFRGFFGLLGQTSFDLLDGCTPAPMFNYEPEELAEAMPEGMYAFCGVPSTLFCQGLETDVILKYAERIMTAFKGRGILNIGDILPPNGDIELVIELGRYVNSR